MVPICERCGRDRMRSRIASPALSLTSQQTAVWAAAVTTDFPQKEHTMARVLVLYYSSWGHMEQMGKASAEGAREAVAQVTVKRVPELVPLEVGKASHYKLDQDAPVADPLELENYDGFVFGISTRYGQMASQVKNFLGQT